ncbi:hypothetical protein GCM10027093_60270 [Paraburkholderia jirisanensis]
MSISRSDVRCEIVGLLGRAGLFSLRSTITFLPRFERLDDGVHRVETRSLYLAVIFAEITPGFDVVTAEPEDDTIDTLTCTVTEFVNVLPAIELPGAIRPGRVPGVSTLT